MLDTPWTASSTCFWVISELPTYATTLGSCLAQPDTSKVSRSTPPSTVARAARHPRWAEKLIDHPLRCPQGLTHVRPLETTTARDPTTACRTPGPSECRPDRARRCLDERGSSQPP